MVFGYSSRAGQYVRCDPNQAAELFSQKKRCSRHNTLSGCATNCYLIPGLGVIKQMKKMMKLSKVKRIIVLFAFLPILLLLGATAANAQKAENFTLKDQFNSEIGVAFPSDKAVILVFGDREGSEQVEGWVRPIYNKFGDRVYIFGIAELSAVPSVAKPVVRRIIKNKSKTSVMLDWSGDVSDAYGCEKGKANVFVIKKNGDIVAIKRGAATNAALEELYREIQGAL